MCGILFYAGKEQIEKNHPSLEIIAHRGPDNVSVKNFLHNNNNITLGHRRLSIIDLSDSAHQPMNYESTNLWLTFNGEIYNYKILKIELESFGYKFKTDSDTEVLLAAYHKWGVDCLNRFNGMFSFVIWNESTKVLFAAKDRYGIKPMYFWNSTKGFGISSEIKQLSVLDGFKNELNPIPTYQFLEFGDFSYDENTMWKNVYEIEPGTCFTIDFNSWKPGMEFSKKKWYSPDFDSKPDYTISNDEANEKFLELFKSSIHKRLQADVDVAALVSGGLDSSSIVSFISKNGLTNSPIQTFSMIYNEKAFSEEKYIGIINKELGLNSTLITYNYEGYTKDLDKVIWYNDLPTVGRSILSHYYLYQNINSDKYKVVLEGQGADEYMAGYGGFHLAYLCEQLHGLRFKKFFKEYQGFKKTRNGSLNSDVRSILEYGFPKTYKKMRKSDGLTGIFEFGNVDTESLNRREHNQVKKVFRSRFSILRSILHSVDRVSMSNSVETRVPFLDHELVDFVLKLPFNFKIKGGVRKSILRESLKSYIPERIYNRKDKMGFSSPESVWLSNQLKDFLVDEIEAASNLPFVNSTVLKSKVDQFLNKEADLDKSIVRLINLNHWIKVYNIDYEGKL